MPYLYRAAYYDSEEEVYRIFGPSRSQKKNADKDAEKLKNEGYFGVSIVMIPGNLSSVEVNCEV